jgi:hypothetical protein
MGLSANVSTTTWAFTDNPSSTAITNPVQIATRASVQFGELLSTAPIGVNLVELISDEQIFLLVETWQGSHLSLVWQHQMARIWQVIRSMGSFSVNGLLDAQIFEFCEKWIILVKWIFKLFSADDWHLVNVVVCKKMTDHGVDDSTQVFHVFNSLLQLLGNCSTIAQGTANEWHCIFP